MRADVYTLTFILRNGNRAMYNPGNKKTFTMRNCRLIYVLKKNNLVKSKIIRSTPLYECLYYLNR